MALRLPTGDDLQRLARANYFELNEEELAAFQDLIPGLFANYELLEQMTEPREPLKYRTASWGPGLHVRMTLSTRSCGVAGSRAPPRVNWPASGSGSRTTFVSLGCQ